MQRVLIIGKVWPEPGSSAAGSRTIQLIELVLEQNWKLDFASAAGESEFAADLGESRITKHKVEINSSAFDGLVKQLDPTIVIFDRFTTEEQFGWRVAEHCPGALRVLDTSDLHCLRNARQAAVKEKREFTANDLLTSEAAMREVASIYRCDLSLLVSRTEIDILQNTLGVPAELLYYLPLFYPKLSAQNMQTWKSYDERAHFISIGNFLHEPNWDSVLHLKNNIWPFIRKRPPKAEMHIYGAYATQKVFDLHNQKEGFLIRGRAENAGSVMAIARVCLAPLRFGAGIKGKLLDAMLYGTPSVTSRVGTESMHFDLDWNGTIADNAEEFADAAVELYTNRTKWETAQQNGAAIINTLFPKETYGPKFLQIIQETLKDLKRHRLRNFTGSMLNRQANAASRYMALWIEEKNKLPKKV